MVTRWQSIDALKCRKRRREMKRGTTCGAGSCIRCNLISAFFTDHVFRSVFWVLLSADFVCFVRAANFWAIFKIFEIEI